MLKVLTILSALLRTRMMVPIVQHLPAWKLSASPIGPPNHSQQKATSSTPKTPDSDSDSNSDPELIYFPNKPKACSPVPIFERTTF
jgi:hypothetical protein